MATSANLDSTYRLVRKASTGELHLHRDHSTTPSIHTSDIEPNCIRLEETASTFTVPAPPYISSEAQHSPVRHHCSETNTRYCNSSSHPRSPKIGKSSRSRCISCRILLGTEIYSNDREAAERRSSIETAFVTHSSSVLGMVGR